MNVPTMINKTARIFPSYLELRGLSYIAKDGKTVEPRCDFKANHAEKFSAIVGPSFTQSTC